MADFIVTGPDGQRYRISAPEAAQDAREAAAARMQQAVQPEGGRKEGAISQWIDSQGERLADQLESILSRSLTHPEDLVGPGEIGALKLVPTAGIPVREKAYGITKHFFDLIDADSGQKVGWVEASHNPRTKNVNVDMIQSEKPRTEERTGSLGFAINPDASSLGLRDIRSLLPEAKREFPDAETVSGFRVTGARNASGQIGGMTLPLPGSRAKTEVEPRPQALDPEVMDFYSQQLSGERAPPSLYPHETDELLGLGPGPASLR